MFKYLSLVADRCQMIALCKYSKKDAGYSKSFNQPKQHVASEFSDYVELTVFITILII